MTAAALGVLAYLVAFGVAAMLERAASDLPATPLLDALRKVAALLALPVIAAAGIGDTAGRWIARRAR